MMYLSAGSRFWLVAFTLVAVYVASRVTNNAAKRLDFITSHRTAPHQQQQMVPVQQPDGSWNPIPWQTWQQPAPVEPPPPPPPADFSFRLAKVWISMFLVVECPLLVIIVILEKTY